MNIQIALACCLAWTTPAWALYETCTDFGHFDLSITVARPQGQQMLDAQDIFPFHSARFSKVVPADFGDFAGGPHKTDDPGWVVSPGQLKPGETLWFRAKGALQYWNPASKTWQAPPNGERVRYFGAIPTEVFLRNDAAELARYERGTIWSASGLEGPLESPIDQAASDGSIHTHLDFCVEDAQGDCGRPGNGHTGKPALGAYLIEMELFATGSFGNLRATRPIQVLLNQGLKGAACSEAMGALVNRHPQRPAAAAGILIMDGATAAP
jgi:hypothetical protein